MRRRDLVTILAGAAAYPLLAGAQQQPMPVIGFLGGSTPENAAFTLAAFREGLKDTGFLEGRNVAIEYRWAEGRYERLPALAADLVVRGVNVIVASGGTPAALAAKGATSVVPIVFVSDDPVERGLVASLARPGGNLTGVSLLGVELMAKRLELLADLVPQLRSIALLVNPKTPVSQRLAKEAEQAARAKGVQLQIESASTDSEMDVALAAIIEQQARALFVAPDVFFISRRGALADWALRHRMPTVYQHRDFAEAGGLISYGPSLTGALRQVGVYTGKIINGAAPADLPVEQPTKIELVINLKSAKMLGLTVPQALLARADEVIE